MIRIVFYEEGFINLTKMNLVCRPLESEKIWWSAMADAPTFERFMLMNGLHVNETNQLETDDGRTWGVVQ